VGGLDKGLEDAGMKVKWQVEIDPYCRKVLAKHWPDVERFEDVREVGVHNLAAVDLVCGGFPCQDISNAGKRAGIDGARSGLWAEFARLIRELRPQLVLVENVAALLNRGMGRVLGDLAEGGYDAKWDCIPAAAVGAPHIRNRVFILAYTASVRRSGSVDELRRDGPSQQARKGWMFQSVGTVAPDRRQWATEPDVGRVADGVPDRVDRLRTLGNAVVPQVAEWIGRRIIESLTTVR
jgi:DNA (cytosine-5)-methyltransferase 1